MVPKTGISKALPSPTQGTVTITILINDALVLITQVRRDLTLRTLCSQEYIL